MPGKTEWLLAFAIAFALWMRFYIAADREGLIIVHRLFHVETLNMPGGCLVSVHYPVVEVVVLGAVLAVACRTLRGVVAALKLL